MCNRIRLLIKNAKRPVQGQCHVLQHERECSVHPVHEFGCCLSSTTELEMVDMQFCQFYILLLIRSSSRECRVDWRGSRGKCVPIFIQMNCQRNVKHSNACHYYYSWAMVQLIWPSFGLCEHMDVAVALWIRTLPILFSHKYIGLIHFATGNAVEVKLYVLIRQIVTWIGIAMMRYFTVILLVFLMQWKIAKEYD